MLQEDAIKNEAKKLEQDPFIEDECSDVENQK